MTVSKKQHAFYSLTNEKVLEAVEAGIALKKPKVRATGRILTLNSLENRVYEIELDDGSSVVVKLYRPKRWSEDQLIEEHQFLEKLDDLEIPVVSPLPLQDSKKSQLTPQATLAQTDEGIYFTIFPKVRGRLNDELSETQLQTLGRYLGRIHHIGADFELDHRIELNTETFGWEPLEYLLQTDFLDEAFRPRYEAVCRDFIERAEDALDNLDYQTVHGDCHLGNTLWEGDKPFFLDFDDMVVAPPVQDVWMIIRGRGEEFDGRRNTLLNAYDQMFEFDRSTLGCGEYLRGLRIIHFSAWIARRWTDPLFRSTFEDFATPEYWNKEMEQLTDALAATQSLDGQEALY